MMLRKAILPVVCLLAGMVGSAVGDDGLRLVSITAGRVTAALGYTPLNPANNLSDVSVAGTARTNLGLGTAATQNTGTSGGTLCLLNTSCAFSGSLSVGKASAPGYVLDVVFPIVGSSATRQLQFSDNTNTTLAMFASTSTVNWTSNVGIGLSSNNSPVSQLYVATGGIVGVGTSSATGQAGELALAKAGASGTAPGAGNLKLAVVAGTTGGTCRLVAYAGTSTTPSTLLDNIGSGC